MQSDVIFCTSDKTLDLSKGAVSKSVLDAAGYALQAECRGSYPQGINFGEVVRTGAHNLACKHVYHGVCPKWDDNAGRTEQVINNIPLLTYR